MNFRIILNSVPVDSIRSFSTCSHCVGYRGCCPDEQSDWRSDLRNFELLNILYAQAESFVSGYESKLETILIRRENFFKESLKGCPPLKTA